jgi:flagellar motor switch protein FliG
MTDKTLAPIQQAAVMLMSLSEDESAEILKHLDPREVQKIGQAMTELRDVERTQVDQSLRCVLENAERQTNLGVGSEDSIRQMIVSAFGESQGSTVADSILISSQSKGIDSLQWMEPKGIADLIRFEHPQIQALIICQLEADVAAQVLVYYDERLRLDLIMRISNQDSVQPMAMDELNSIIEQQIKKQNVTQTTPVGGVKVSADIMNLIDPEIKDQIMEAVKEQNEDLAVEIEELMFIFENILDIDDRGIQTLLREVSTDLLILALKGADQNIQDKIFNNMSKRAADLLKDDLEAKGPVKLTEVENAQKEILMTAKKMADSGEISLGGRGGEQMV